MFKKKTYKRPDEIIVNGEKVTFHYNREERLHSLGAAPVEKKESFLSKKFRYLHIMLADIVIIAIIGFTFSYFYGRATTVKEGGFIYNLSKKPYSKEIWGFTFQIKNTTKEKQNLDGNYYLFKVVDEKGEIKQTKDFFVTKLSYNPGEYYIENFVVNDLKKGFYEITISTPPKPVIKLNLEIK